MQTIIFLSGSLRKKSLNTQVVHHMVDLVRDIGGVKAEFIDISAFEIPVFNADSLEASGMPEDVLKLRDKFANADGFFISTPEYNYSVPGGLKNIIDWLSINDEAKGLSDVFKGKYAAISAAAASRYGGINSLNMLRVLLSCMGVNVIAEQVAIAECHKNVGQNAEIHDKMAKKLLRDQAEKLVQAVL